jgi:preprotein translocase subunit SecG
MVSKLEFVNIMETEYKAVTKFESWLGIVFFSFCYFLAYHSVNNENKKSNADHFIN